VPDSTFVPRETQWQEDGKKVIVSFIVSGKNLEGSGRGLIEVLSQHLASGSEQVLVKFPSE
jgi:hypothetical protein